MTTVLDSHVKAFGEETRRPLDVNDAILQLEELIDLGLRLFESVKNGIERWKNQVQSGRRPLRLQDGQMYRDFLAGLDKGFTQIAAHIAFAIERGIALEIGIQGRSEFEEARRELQLLVSISLERVIQAVEHVAQGKTRPLGAVMDELRDRHRT